MTSLPKPANGEKRCPFASKTLATASDAASQKYENSIPSGESPSRCPMVNLGPPRNCCCRSSSLSTVVEVQLVGLEASVGSIGTSSDTKGVSPRTSAPQGDGLGAKVPLKRGGRAGELAVEPRHGGYRFQAGRPRHGGHRFHAVGAGRDGNRCRPAGGPSAQEPLSSRRAASQQAAHRGPVHRPGPCPGPKSPAQPAPRPGLPAFGPRRIDAKVGIARLSVFCPVRPETMPTAAVWKGRYRSWTAGTITA